MSVGVPAKERVHNDVDVGGRCERKVHQRHPDNVDCCQSEPEDVCGDTGRIVHGRIKNQRVNQQQHERREQPVQHVGGFPFGSSNRGNFVGDDGSSVHQVTDGDDQQEFNDWQGMQDPVTGVYQRKRKSRARTSGKYVFVLLDNDHYRHGDKKRRSKNQRQNKQRGERQDSTFKPQGQPKQYVENDKERVTPVRIHCQIISSSHY